MHPHEKAIIQAFFTPTRRARWLEALASEKRRGRMLDRLNHCRDLDVRYSTSLHSNTNLSELLRSRGAPALCYVLSNTTAIDGREMPLDEAIAAAELGGWGTIIGCLPGRLAYFYDECGERRMLLERSAS